MCLPVLSLGPGDALRNNSHTLSSLKRAGSTSTVLKSKLLSNTHKVNLFVTSEFMHCLVPYSCCFRTCNSFYVSCMHNKAKATRVFFFPKIILKLMKDCRCILIVVPASIALRMQENFLCPPNWFSLTKDSFHLFIITFTFIFIYLRF